VRRCVTLRGPATPEQAWERYAVPALWSTWAPQIRRVDYPSPRITVGGRGRVHGVGGLAVDFLVVAVDEASRNWAWVVGVGPVRLRLDHGVEAFGDGSRTTLVVDGPAPVVLAYVPIARLVLGRLLRA
jgi:hypothetical protein